MNKLTKNKILSQINISLINLKQKGFLVGGAVRSILLEKAIKDIDNIIESSYQNFNFVRILKKDERADFFLVQNTNNCFIKFYRYSNKKLIIVSLIDNLIKGGAGQAIQCMNLIFGYDESMSF